jgi:hypothetical protein
MAFWSPSSLQDINEGSTANDGTGDSLRDAFFKVDSNFTSISNQLGSVNQDFVNANVQNTLRVGSTITANVSMGNVTNSPTFYGNLNIGAHVIPLTNGMYDLGSPTNRLRTVYSLATDAASQIQSSSDSGLLLVHANAFVGDQQDTGIFGNITSDYSSHANTYCFFGHQYTTNNFVYKITNTDATKGNSVVYDGIYGNVQFGSLFLSNTTEATSNVTGALIVRGGISTSANIFAAGNIFSRGFRVLNTADVSTLGYPTYNGSGSLFVGNTVFATTTPSTTTTTGAVVVLGGIGVAANVVASGYVGDFYGNVVKAAQPYITSLGSLTGLTVNGTTSTTSLQATSVGTIDLLSTGTITATTINSGGTITAVTVLSPTVGNTGTTLTGTLSTGNQPNITSLGTVVVANFSTANAVVNGGSINNTLIGNATPSTGRFTTVIATTVNAGTIGNVGAAVIGATGRFDTSVTTSTLTAATIGNTGAAVIGATGRFDTSVTTATVNAATIGNTGAALTGTLSTAAQPNVTSLGTLTGLTVSGAIVPSVNNTINVGSSGSVFATVYATTFSGVSTTAKYADLAENYQADSAYAPGTVIVFGGDAEVTTTKEFADARVAGAVSTDPAHLMNGGLSGINVVALALRGRVPCKVIGPVQKGDLLVTSTTPGFAQSVGTDRLYGLSVFAKALETNLNSGEKVIEVVIL